MKKFITLDEAFGRMDEAKKGGGFPATHSDYMKKYFPDEEEAPEDGENISWKGIPQSQTGEFIDKTHPQYSTKFADQLAAQMYPKQKEPSRKLTPAEVYQTMNTIPDEDGDDFEHFDPHERQLRPNPRISHHWTDEAKQLYSGIADGTQERITFELDGNQSEYFSKMKSSEIYEVLDQALDNNLDISNSIWDLMQSKNKKLYNDLRKSVGIGVKTKPDDFELFNILKKHPDHSGRRGVKYKPNAGSYKLKDLKKRIRSKYGDSAEDKIKELEGFINQNRRFPQ